MSKKKRPPKVSAPSAPPAVLHGSAFVTMIDEARSLCNEVVARREFDADVVEFLRSKGLFDEWGAWRDAKRAPKS